ncbi:MAG: hypothetical protein H0V09_04425 [Gemmatimonadetes bacterium]|nr:hypothetical protein [Gemmatimonadota bacterium]
MTIRSVRRAIRGAGSSLLAAAACTLALSCASRPVETVSAGPARSDAALRVVNRTLSDVRVQADGRALGDVSAQSEQLFVGLAPGTLDLRGVSADGELSFERDLLTLGPGETFTWVLREDGGRAGDPAAAEPRAGGASLVVENETSWTVDVFLDEQVLGTTGPSSTGRFDGIPPGSHRLEARAPETTFPREFPVLEAGETFTWRLRAPASGSGRMTASGGILPAPGTGRLRVENPHPEALEVLVNGTRVGPVEAGNTRIFDEMAVARVLLSAESPDGRTRYRGPSTSIEPGRVTLWRIGSDMEVAGPGFESRPDDDREVRRPGTRDEGDASEDVYAPEEEIFADVEPRRDEEPEDVPPPTVRAGSGKVFVVQNLTGQDLEVLLDGHSLGAVGAGMTETFSSLPGTRFTPSARDASGRREFDHPPVDLSTRDSFTWIIQP